MNPPSAFWDALAPHHAAIEDSYLDRASVRRLLNEIQSPVLVVGAGQGLIVAELRKKGFACDGVDSSPEMVRYAKLRRGIDLVQADARALPFAGRGYGTVIYATGVVDFTDDEDGIRAMLAEARRIVKERGTILVAFYRLSAAAERFLARVGLLRNHELALRQSFEPYQLNPAQMIAWVARRAGLGRWRATVVLLRLSALCTRQERRMTFRMQRIFRDQGDPRSFLNTAPEKQPYRDEGEIRNLFRRLGIPIRQLRAMSSSTIVRI